MAYPRFYCGPADMHPLQPGMSLALPANAAAHASRALRMQAGDKIKLFNGDGHDYLAELASMSKNQVMANILAVEPIHNESPLRITLAQGISSGDRMDFTIQKAVEMGISAIQPISTQRSVVKLNGERAEKRREHWQNIVISACEQSGRAQMPLVAAPLSLANWLSQLPASGMRLTLSPGATLSLRQLPAPSADIYLLIGCEGGLTQEEISLAASQGFTSVLLGQRILRTETAALATLAAIQTLWGDY